MIERKTEMQEVPVPESITCDVCKKKYYYDRNDRNEGINEDIMEIQEFHHIYFVGGYKSIFGDENVITGDICQHCLKEKLGEYLAVNKEQ